MGRTQEGNNNAYCQDNELSWLDWNLQNSNADLLDFTRQLIHFRRRHPVFRRRRWFQGQAIHGSAVSDIGWYNSDGGQMTEEQWSMGFARAIAVFFNGEEIPEVGYKGEPVMDESFMLFFNAHYEMIEFEPEGLRDRKWRVVIDTKEPYFINDWVFYTEDKPVPVTERSVVVLQRC